MGLSRSDSEGNSLMIQDLDAFADPPSPQEQYAAELRFNNAIREVFLNRFVHIFSAYEHFVIHPNQVSSNVMRHKVPETNILLML
jgi:hypothetical protein